MDTLSYLLGKKSSGGDTSDLSKYFYTEISSNTTVANNYATNIVKMTAPLTIANNVTDLTGCFVNSNYSGIDFSQADTSNVTKMESMFQNCLLLENLYIENIDVSNVINFRYMFNNCIKLKKLDLSKWTPKSSGIDVRNMFQNCKKLAVLDVSSFSSFGSSEFSSVGTECLQSDGAYADGIPYVYVKNETIQSNIVNGYYGASGWTTNNVIVKQ